MSAREWTKKTQNLKVRLRKSLVENVVDPFIAGAQQLGH